MTDRPTTPAAQGKPWLDVDRWAVGIAVAGLVAGGVAALLHAGFAATLLWSAATVPVLALLLVQIVTSLRRGAFGLDLVAALSMSSALVFGESLAANVVALMYAGGQLLERFAEGRARSEMTALLGRVPRTAMRRIDGRLEQVDIDTLVPGDVVLVRSGETLPVDGTLVGAAGAVLDESTLTGESLPVTHPVGDEVLSGSGNVGEAFELRVSRPAAESTYARIVKLVQTAQESKAPVVRMADQLAIWFLLVTLIVAALGWWLSGDRIRALAVLVVATPCPLILALPVALISGMSRAARLGILIKNGGALEALSRTRTVIFDKTGTLTRGVAEVTGLRPATGCDEATLLCLAASLDQASHHVVAEALVKAARARGLPLTPPLEIAEEAGAGIAGQVDGHAVAVGGSSFLAARGAPLSADARDGLAAGTAMVGVAIDGAYAGLIVLNDPLRPEVGAVLTGLRHAGISRIVMASGDRQDVVDAVATTLGLDAAVGALTPPEKLALVERETARAPTMMVGDGINDAPALATATIGIAMGARGAAASSETAGIVVLVDQLDRILSAVEIAARTRRIAIESVAGGLLLSFIGMLAAAAGLLTPVAGAMVQEAIDVAVILNALRALR